MPCVWLDGEAPPDSLGGLMCGSALFIDGLSVALQEVDNNVILDIQFKDNKLLPVEAHVSLHRWRDTHSQTHRKHIYEHLLHFFI